MFINLAVTLLYILIIRLLTAVVQSSTFMYHQYWVCVHMLCMMFSDSVGHVSTCSMYRFLLSIGLCGSTIP